MTLLKKLGLAVSAGFVFMFAGAAQAATCTAASFTDPDATLTNSTSCGSAPLNDANDSGADLDALLAGGLTGWTELAKIDAPGSADGDFSATGLNPAGTFGDWAFNSVAGTGSYLIVIKDGAVDDPSDPTPPKDKVQWFWFVVDTSAGCTIGSFAGAFDFCGGWTMYGEGGRAKAISHLTLYGNVDGGGDDDEVPEPASLVLVGLGLLAVGLTRRRREA